MSDRIVAVEAVTVVLELPRPLQLGPMTISRRAYAVVTVATAGGFEGRAYALSRDAPIAACVNEQLAPVLLGRDADLISACWEAGFRGTIAAGRVGAVIRALSLVDIALWDIKAQRAGLPLWRLLGGYGPRVPAVMVAGYPTGQQPEELGERVAAYGRAGWRLLKLARVPDPGEMRRLLATVSDSAPTECELIVDAAWAWERPVDAAREVASWGEVPLAWLEDPLPPEAAVAYARLRRLAAVPIGVGDEVTDPVVYRRLIDLEGLDVLRLDVTTIGGFTTAPRVLALASAAGIPVSLHVYPETHVHLAAATSDRAIAETFDPEDNPFDLAHRLYTGGPKLEAGFAVASEAPGLGVSFDLELIEHHRRP
jgi:L-alanine-DL-glutamate epimerase-like enolase superfamily enzyme